MTDRPRVLLVEDEKTISTALCALLDSWGYDVFPIANGVQVIPHMRADLPALVILDTTLPDQSGYAVCQSIRLDNAFDKVPILAMSSDPSRTEARKLGALGINALLTKPFAIADLQTEAERLIQGGAHA